MTSQKVSSSGKYVMISEEQLKSFIEDRAKLILLEKQLQSFIEEKEKTKPVFHQFCRDCERLVQQRWDKNADEWKLVVHDANGSGLCPGSGATINPGGSQINDPNYDSNRDDYWAV